MLRIELLQRALRRRLLDPLGRRFALNRRDPLRQAADFAELDAMADALWGDCETVQTAALAALSTARTLAVAMSSSMPTPHSTRPSAAMHST